MKIAGYFGFPQIAGALFRRCADEDEAVRATALEHVGYLDDPRALPTLLHALSHDTPRARAAAAQALGHVDADGAMDALLTAVVDTDLWYRYFSAMSLGHRGDAWAVPVLHRLLAADPAQPVRIAAADALGRLGGEAAALALTPFTDDDDAEVAMAVLRACGSVDAEGVDEPLRRALESPDPVRRRAAVDALVRWGRAAAIARLRATAGGDADPIVAQDAAVGLATLAGRPEEAGRPRRFGAGRSGRGTGARRACDRRARQYSRAGHSAARSVSRLARSARCGGPVAEALGRVPHEAASAYLRDALEDTDAIVREKAIAALARVGAAGIARKLAEMARDDPRPPFAGRQARR